METRKGRKVGTEKFRPSCLECKAPIDKGPAYSSLKENGWLCERHHLARNHVGSEKGVAQKKSAAL